MERMIMAKKYLMISSSLFTGKFANPKYVAK